MGQRLDDVATNCRQISSILVPHTVVEEEGLFPEMAEELPDHIEVLRGEHREIESVVDEAARGFPGDPTCPDRLVGVSLGSGDGDAVDEEHNVVQLDCDAGAPCGAPASPGRRGDAGLSSMEPGNDGLCARARGCFSHCGGDGRCGV
jgi:Hemerythrin HHE cation binding domain